MFLPPFSVAAGNQYNNRPWLFGAAMIEYCGCLSHLIKAYPPPNTLLLWSVGKLRKCLPSAEGNPGFYVPLYVNQWHTKQGA